MMIHCGKEFYRKLWGYFYLLSIHAHKKLPTEILSTYMYTEKKVTIKTGCVDKSIGERNVAVSSLLSMAFRNEERVAGRRLFPCVYFHSARLPSRRTDTEEVRVAFVR